jgi:hypothetical protein
VKAARYVTGEEFCVREAIAPLLEAHRQMRCC